MVRGGAECLAEPGRVALLFFQDVFPSALGALLRGFGSSVRNSLEAARANSTNRTRKTATAFNRSGGNMHSIHPRKFLSLCRNAVSGTALSIAFMALMLFIAPTLLQA